MGLLAVTHKEGFAETKEISASAINHKFKEDFKSEKRDFN